jgi:hypothetical protein
MKILLPVLLVLVIASPASARARQKPPAPPPTVAEGSRIRVTLLARHTPKVIGSVLALSADSLIMTTTVDTLPAAIARIDVKKLELSRGMHSNAGKGATIGALAGAVLLGALIASAASIDATSNETVVMGMAGAAVGAVGGAAVGAVIGSASRSERWEKVPVR